MADKKDTRRARDGSWGWQGLNGPLAILSKITKFRLSPFSTYADNCATVIDQAGKKRKSCADGLGRLTQVFEPDAAGNFTYETDYQYDVLDDLTRVDQKGGDPNSSNWRTRLFTYNSLSQLLTAYNPEAATITYTYDSDGNVLTR